MASAAALSSSGVRQARPFETVYARLVILASADLAELRSGDLLARLVGDVDGLANLWLRFLLPCASATVVAVGTIPFVCWMVSAGGLVPAR